ncbi:hypothetical protein VTJ49DRAFT_7259 [Mycothermus thermophilus]|uniref:Uncharacterized protein n=1 Tax=Humicola insolens TaxID=85995 RepID=A0ABR3VHG2_HUMIN
MLDHRYHHQHQHPHFDHGAFPAQYQHQHNNQQQQQQQLEAPLLRMQRKRKADAPPENNERLSKRMSLLNLGMRPPFHWSQPIVAYASETGNPQLTLSASENSGQKLYVPVENPDFQAATAAAASTADAAKPKKSHRTRAPVDDSVMQLDDSKYKVYIYNLDDELSSSDNESDTSSSADNSNNTNGKLVFLPDIEKHLRANRIPTRVLQDPRPDPRAELAGKELVLYSVPTSLSVPAEQDSVRKAIIEARARARERQKAELEMAAAARKGMMPTPATPAPAPSASASSLGTSHGVMAMDAEPLMPPPPMPTPVVEDDPDAMELD